MRLLNLLLPAFVTALLLGCDSKSPPTGPDMSELTQQINQGVTATAVTAADDEPALAPGLPGMPETVTNLAVSAVTDTSLTVTFTEVANGQGGPATYEIRHALNTLQWWLGQPVASGTCKAPVAGGTSGTLRSCTIAGLAATSTYQLQLVAFRGTLNVNAVFGALSNVATGKTVAKSVAVASVAVSPLTVTDTVGKRPQFQAAVKDAAGNMLSGRTVAWTSSDTTVLTVTNVGLATGRGVGTATVTATSGGKTGTATVRFVASAPGAVKDLVTSSVTDSSVTVSFTEVPGGTGQPASYDVRIQPSPLAWWLAKPVTRGSCTTPVAGTAAGTRRSCTILGLTPATGYGVQIISFRGTLAVNAVFGALSNVVTATTTAPVAVATVSLSPTSANVVVGATTRFTAVLRDAAGRTLTGRTVTWSSTNTGAATVDNTGLARGVAAGSATITATSEGRSGTASVMVPTVVSSAAECATPRAGWIFCDDFEQDRLARYFEVDNAGGNFARTSATGFNGSVGMRARWLAGNQNAGGLHLAIGKTPLAYFRPADAGTANYREIYWRMYVKHQAGWVGGGADKLSRAFIFANGNWAQAAIGHVWSGASAGADGNYLLADVASGTDANGNLMTTAYNDFANLRWLGAAKGALPVFDASHVGQWYCVEAHMKLNDAGSSNGVLEFWVNGTLQGQRTGLNWVGSYSQYGINAIYFENYWNAGSVATQERYFDNIVVSTARIGCTS